MGPVHSMPSNYELIRVIKNALTDGMHCASRFGMNFELSDITKFPLKNLFGERIQPGMEPDTFDEDEDFSDDPLSLMNRPENLNLRNYGDGKMMAENDNFLEICEEDGTKKTVLKSSIVWILQHSIQQAEKYRLERVKSRVPTTASGEGSAKRRKLTSKCTSSDIIFEADEIFIGQWCVFKNSTNENEHCFNNVIVGSMLGFQFATGNTDQDKQYLHEFVTILDEEKNNRKDIEAVWYMLQFDGTLVSLGTKSCFYVNIENYVGTTKKPVILRNDTTPINILSLEEIAKNNGSFVEFINRK